MILHDYHLRNSTSFNKNKIKVSKNLLIFGSGRWARIILGEIIKNFPNVKTYIYSNNLKELKKSIKSKKYKNVFLIENFQKIKKIKCNFAIVANKTKNHFFYCYKLLKLNFNLLVEKPFTLKHEDSVKLAKISFRKKNFLLISLQYFYAKYFYYIKKKVLKNFTVERIKIEWFDKKNEIRNNMLKTHDLEINYAEDIFYHIYSILEVLLGKGNYEFKKNINNDRSKSILFFNYQKIKIALQYSRNFSIRKRMIKIYCSKNNKIFINFSKDSKVQVRINKYLIKLTKSICDTTLKYQLFSFLNLKNYNLDFLFNDVRNLNNLFVSLKKLQNFFKKKNI